MTLVLSSYTVRADHICSKSVVTFNNAEGYVASPTHTSRCPPEAAIRIPSHPPLLISILQVGGELQSVKTVGCRSDSARKELSSMRLAVSRGRLPKIRERCSPSCTPRA